MTADIADLTKAAEKKKPVVLHLIQEDGSTKEVDGKIEAASAAGVAFKPKGSSNLELLEVEKIDSMQFAPEKPKTVIQKKLKPIEEGNMRQHLADRHGVSREWCNKATEQQAVDYHDSLDHSDMGHKHVAPDEKADEAENGEENAA